MAENNDESASTALKELQDHIATNMGLAELGKLENYATQFMAPFIKQGDAGILTLTYLALKMTTYIEARVDV